jgi:hypothetical protein
MLSFSIDDDSCFPLHVKRPLDPAHPDKLILISDLAIYDSHNCIYRVRCLLGVFVVFFPFKKTQIMQYVSRYLFVQRQRQFRALYDAVSLRYEDAVGIQFSIQDPSVSGNGE